MPDEAFDCPLGTADILRTGSDVTMIGWGTQIHVLLEVAEMAKDQLNVNCEVIDLVSILPWDRETVCEVSRFAARKRAQNSTQIYLCSPPL